MGYLKRATIGFSWLGAFKVFTRGLAVVRIVIIARLLSPKDLGLFGLATIALSFVEVFTETGINIFLIQTKERIERYIDTAWVISLVRGIGISFCIICAAFGMSWFYKEPELLYLILLVSVIPLFRGAINPAIVKYLKTLEYHKNVILRGFLTIIEVGSTIVLTWILRSPIALVLGLVISAFSEMIISHSLRPRPKFRYSKDEAKHIFSFGRWLNISGVLSFLGNNMDNLIVGKLLGTAPLGYYQTAFNIAQSATAQIGDVASQTVFPIYTKIHNDRKRLIRAIILAAVPLAIVLLIPIVIMHIWPQELVRLVLGEKWLPVIPTLPFLFFSGYLQGINSVMYPVFYTREKPQYYALIVCANLLLMIFFLIPFSLQFGIVGASIAVCIARLLIQPLYLFLMVKTLHVSTYV